MKKTQLLFIILGALFTPITAHAGNERDQIRVVGSSTVYPFVTAAAEEFGNKTAFKTPIVEATGTGGGLKLFCSGAGAETPDIAMASREIKESETKLCKDNSIAAPIEIKIGLDGLVIANAASSKKMSLSRKEIFLALAKQIPKDGKLVPNTYKNWSSINASLPNVNAALPDSKIEIYGPPPTSGTRDAFVELVMHHACKEFPEFEKAYPDSAERDKACGLMREDGAYIEAGENDNLIIQKLVNNPTALGIFGYSFLEQNMDKVQGSIIEGKEDSFENIASGTYPISRPLFVYVKREHLKVISGVAEFMQELISDDATGEEGYLAVKGLIPLPKAEHDAIKKEVAAALK
jgi:phosphate transport system substrate-binding protein